MVVAVIILGGVFAACALLVRVWEPARAFWWAAVTMTSFLFLSHFGFFKMLQDGSQEQPLKTPAQEKYAQARARITEAYAKGDIDAEEMGSKLYTILANEETAETIRKSGDGI